MSIIKKMQARQKRRALRVRKTIKRIGDFPRASVFRSMNHIYCQIIDDVAQKTLASCSSIEFDAKGDKSEVAKAVGLELAKRAKENNIEKIAFDRGSFRFHGRVKALADGMREGGLSF